jgi:hypothetical protein
VRDTEQTDSETTFNGRRPPALLTKGDQTVTHPSLPLWALGLVLVLAHFDPAAIQQAMLLLMLLHKP